MKKNNEKILLPNCKMYDYLLERNSDYMNNVALTFENQKITYEELHDKIDIYARALYGKGIRKGDKVAVCLVNNPESVYILYALNKIGAITIGISPLNNKFKMQRDFELVKPKYFITANLFYSCAKQSVNELNVSPILFSPLMSSSNETIKSLFQAKQIIDGNFLVGKEYNLGGILKKYGNNSFKYNGDFNASETTDIMFTGGSSGTHKGVHLNENGINSVVAALDDVLILEPGMKHLGNIPFGHMAFGKVVLHYALCNNLTYALTLDAKPQNFYNELVDLNVDGAMGGPIHWESLIDRTDIKPGSLKRLIQPLSGGEYFKVDKKEKVNEILKFAGCQSQVGDGLGLTEMWAPININVNGCATKGTLGKPIPFVKEKIVDPITFKELIQGETGLLLVTGPGMMLGYHENEEENNKVFVYDEYGTKWYSTGDLARKINDKGEIEYIGRKKRNFVSGMDNIYPEQIEMILQQFPEINEVCVTKIPDDEYQFLPKYHIYLSDNCFDTNKLIDKINATIEMTLGKSALPGYISFEDAPFPRTDNGKMNVTLMQENDLSSIDDCIKLKKIKRA